MMAKPNAKRAVMLFAFLCMLFSWPIFFCADAWLAPLFTEQGDLAAAKYAVLFGHMLGMLGPAVAALMMWRFYHKEPPPPWKWSRPKYYLWIVLAMLAFWAVPALIGVFQGDKIVSPIENYIWICIASMLVLGWVSGMGEETGWCAYLLPRLSPSAGKGRALVVSGVIRGVWHWPILVIPVMLQVIHGEHTPLQLVGAGIVIAIQLIVSNILFGMIFGWIWYRTESISLVGWLHYWYDLVRDVAIILLLSYGESAWMNQWNSIVWLSVGLMVLGTILERERMSWREFFGLAKLHKPGNAV
jgi:membrane protease YdiL (CAAX protease family)